MEPLMNKKRWITLSVAAIILLILPLLLINNDYIESILCFAALYIVAVSGLDINYGYCGQISLGQVAYFAIGAYGSAILNEYTGMPVLLCMFVSSILAAIIGALIAYPCSKLVFHFLSLATMAFGEIMHQFVAHSPGRITGDSIGMFTTHISIFGIQLDTYTKFYYFALICVAVTLVFKVFLINSRTGRAFIAIRDNHHAASGMGVNVVKYKVMAFATSSFFASFPGAMYVHLIRYISPDTIVYKQSVMFLTMLLFGGTASLLGPIVGACSIMFINELLRAAENYQMLIYGAILLIVILVLPGGVYGEAVNLYYRIKTKKQRAREAASSHVDS